MADWLAHKYIGLISPRLERFKRKGPDLYNLRCPFCGDSEVSKKKARGYIYRRPSGMQFHCHNCGITLSVANFIKRLDNSLYNEMMLENFSFDPKQKQKEVYEKREKAETKQILKGLVPVSKLPPEHIARSLVEKRKIPSQYYSKLYYCEKFMRYVNDIKPGKFSEEDVFRYDEHRLIIPFEDKSGNIHAINGRSFRKDASTRYIVIVFDYDTPKIYGLDTVNFNQEVYVFEGPIDSMFIENAIAVGGGEMVSVLGNYSKDNLTLVYDNEPRSAETKAKMMKAIEHGYKVCVWPEYIKEKDINDMVLAGYEPDYIRSIISKHTFSDLRAKLELTTWSKRK